MNSPGFKTLSQSALISLSHVENLRETLWSWRWRRNYREKKKKKKKIQGTFPLQKNFNYCPSLFVFLVLDLPFFEFQNCFENCKKLKLIKKFWKKKSCSIKGSTNLTSRWQKAPSNSPFHSSKNKKNSLNVQGLRSIINKTNPAHFHGNLISNPHLLKSKNPLLSLGPNWYHGLIQLQSKSQFSFKTSWSFFTNEIQNQII